MRLPGYRTTLDDPFGLRHLPEPVDGFAPAGDDLGFVAELVAAVLDDHSTVNHNRGHVGPARIPDKRAQRIADRLEMRPGHIDHDEVGAGARRDAAEIVAPERFGPAEGRRM